MEWYNASKDTSWTKDLPECPCSLPKKTWTTKETHGCRDMMVTITKTHSEFRNPDPSVWENPTSFNLWIQQNTLLFTDYHPGACYDLRSKPIKGHRQQCTYDCNGKLITHGASAGTADFAASTWAHIQTDMRPYDWAIQLDGGKPGKYVAMYLEVRPTDTKNKCPKNP